jgi:hypothetical protein
MEKEDSLETELIAYRVVANAPAIRPAPIKRSWMGKTDDHYAYLCLPLVAANVSGWELLCPVSFSAHWDGGAEAEAVKVTLGSESRWAPFGHFGHGILTLNTGHVFRTSAGHNMWVKGPTNQFKDGLAPLEGVVETDWLPYGFTMSYQFTRPQQTVWFEAGEPFCHIRPVPRGYLHRIEPILRPLNANAELAREHRAWVRTRRKWNAERLVAGTVAAQEKWRKDYLRGQTATGEKATEHARVARVKPFKEVADTKTGDAQPRQKNASERP